MIEFSKVRIVALSIAIGSATTIGSAAETSPNLLLITVDTFRGDYLGANGASQNVTPNLDRLAAGGANFTRARASVPLTLPSHASILTGNYPHTHGLRDNAAGALTAESVTLAEVLADRGYASAAFVASFVLDRRFGLGQGFGLYDDRVSSEVAELESVEAERDGGAVVAAFEDWLEAHGGRDPVFAWLHLYDPHAPYAPPEPYRSRYQGHPYAGEIAYTDELIGRALGALESRGLLEDTLIAVIGDHGEGLGEHGETTHALLIYNSTLHVPMLLYSPGLVPAARVPDLVRSIDLAPTLLDYLGADVDFGEGVSLRSRIERRDDQGGQSSDEISAVSESLYAQSHLGWSPLFALERDRFRLILAPEPELYDLTLDPGETDNRFGAELEVARDLTRQLRQAIDTRAAVRQEDEPPAADSAAVAKLRSLGYLSRPGGDSDPSSASAADPKEKIEVWEQLQQAMALYGRGDYPSAARSLESVLRTEREIPIVYEYLGATYMRLERWESVERLYAQASARGIETASMQVDLGVTYSRREAHEPAEEALTKALALDPSSVKAHYHLGELYRVTGRLGDAVAQLREALTINPNYVFAWNALGRTLAQAGRNDAALEAFEQAVEAAPDEIRGVLNLAVQLERMGREREALTTYERCLTLAGSEFAQAREQAARAVRRLATEQR